MAVSVLLKNVCPLIAEGPHWEESSQCLLFVDILAQEVHRWHSASGRDDVVRLDDTVSFIIPCRTGGYVIGLGRTICMLDWDSGKTSVLCEVEQGTRGRFNDAKCDSLGRLWAGTMGFESVQTGLQLQQGSLYSLHSSGALRRHIRQIDTSNGLAWSSDNHSFYFIDSGPLRKVYAFDFDVKQGVVSNQRTLIDFALRPVEDLGHPDGMCIDEEDKLWIACFDAGKVIRFDPETGLAMQTIHFPAKRITSCCFGGENYDELYVTSARVGISEDELNQNQPLAGSVFRVTGLGVRGKPACVFDC